MSVVIIWLIINGEKEMTHVLFYVALSEMLVLAVFFILLVKISNKTKPESEEFEIG